MRTFFLVLTRIFPAFFPVFFRIPNFFTGVFFSDFQYFSGFPDFEYFSIFYKIKWGPIFFFFSFRSHRHFSGFSEYFFRFWVFFRISQSFFFLFLSIFLDFEYFSGFRTFFPGVFFRILSIFPDFPEFFSGFAKVGKFFGKIRQF